jgi:hypothetical protein
LGVVAVADSVTVGATELGVGNADHVIDAHFLAKCQRFWPDWLAGARFAVGTYTTVWEGVEILCSNGGREGRGDDDELHFDGLGMGGIERGVGCSVDGMRWL